MYYMSTLMHQIGFDDEMSVLMSLVGGFYSLVLFLPDSTSKKRVVDSGQTLSCLAFRRFAVCRSQPIFDNGSTGLYLTGIILYMGFFGSYACLTWVVPSEVYPTQRSYGITTSSATLFLWSPLVTYNFGQMQEAMTKTGVAWDSTGYCSGTIVLPVVLDVRDQGQDVWKRLI